MPFRVPYRSNDVTAKTTIKESRRIVIKIGSALVTDEKSGSVRRDWLDSLAADVKGLTDRGKEIIIVSSGAIALGRKALGISYKQARASIPLEMKQAAASVGQVCLSRAYDESFDREGLKVGMILLTPRDTEERRPHLNARATLHALLDKGIIPVINENDTVSTAEIRFGDNDRLAARVAQMIDADLLIQLSTTDGLYTADPTKDSGATHIPLVETLSAAHFDMAGDAQAGISTGGMKSKLEAARLSTAAGVSMLVAKGTDLHPLRDIQKCTLFKAVGTPASARKKWIGSHLEAKGVLTIDEGAQRALLNGKSLLPAGVVSLQGNFERGDVVSIVSPEGKKMAMGLIAYNSTDARKILGKKSDEIPEILGYFIRPELIHRQDLVLQG
ncbi:MAG: glutamate 5-kinase [Rhodospirillales bacterium]|nr:glutamate 5-kinase [Alphaproteobacteria bacterium]USO03250.1 MAG: glutamate 5-kinase [Rhodospirillales bacterium]